MHVAVRAFVVWAAIVGAAVGLMAAPQSFAAEQAPPLKIAVVDVQFIMRDSKAAKTVHAEVEKQRNAYQNDLAQQENALRAADGQLNSERATLSKEAYQKKRQELDQQAAQLRKNVQTRKDELEKLFSNGIGQIRDALVQVVAEIAQAKGVTLVLYKSQVLLAANTYDITAETLKKLDAKLPSVKLTK